MTSVMPTMTSVMFAVNQKPQRRFSTKGEINNALLCLSRGYPAHKLFGQKDPHMDRRLQSSLQCASTDTQHPHHHLVTYETVDNPSLDGLLKSATAVELSPQDANMVRLAPDRCDTIGQQIGCGLHQISMVTYIHNMQESESQFAQ